MTGLKQQTEALPIFAGISQTGEQLEPVACLGSAARPDLLVSSVVPSPTSCFGPRGATIIDHTLWICDTGHHRLLGYKTLPQGDLGAADILIGQPSFDREGRNARGVTGAATLNVPTGICGLPPRPGSTSAGLAVADAWNHRILIWHSLPTHNNQPADLVLGQVEFCGDLANRGADAPTAQTMHWPYGVHFAEGKLLVADSGNRRLLIWWAMPTKNGQAADLVLGQRDFVTRDENAGSDASAMSMCWPHGIAIWNGKLCVSDAGNNRVMIWQDFPSQCGTACDIVLGQNSLTKFDHNQSSYKPGAATLNMPYAAAASKDWLLIADTANSRIVAFHESDITIGAAARALFGQKDFNGKGDNRWKPACPDSICWPYNLSVSGDLACLADSGNNRVSIWKLAL
ncbi:MAG: hypothetical protein KGS72_01250 [Cyanobacteria bacterium REEB67]|nr:hypothetical protein [Cyanobacteria bacterium REEB67]